MNGWSCSPKQGPARFTVLKNLFVWMLRSFSKTFKSLPEPCSSNNGQVLFTVVKHGFVWMLCSHLNTFRLMAELRSPTSPVTAQLFLRRWRIVWFWCCADFEQSSNERMVVLPQTQPSCFHGVANCFFLDFMKLLKNIRTYGWAVLPQTRPSSFHGVEEPYRLDVMQSFKNIQIDGWAELPNIPCHGPAHFLALKNLFVLMLCRHATTFKWTAGRVPPNTTPLISRCWRLFLFEWYEAFQQHWNGWPGRTSPNTAQYFSRCWRTISSGCSAAR